MLLAQKNEILRNAIETHSARHSMQFYKDLEEIGKELEKWAGKKMFRQGRKPLSAILASNEKDYGSATGIGIFLESEKYNDMRGWLLEILEAAQAVQDENENLKKRETDYMAMEFWLVDLGVKRWPRSKLKKQAAYEQLRRRVSFGRVRDTLDACAEEVGLKLVGQHDDE